MKENFYTIFKGGLLGIPNFGFPWTWYRKGFSIF